MQADLILSWYVTWPEHRDAGWLKIDLWLSDPRLMESTIRLAKDLELRVPTLLPKEVMMQEIEITDETAPHKEDRKQETYFEVEHKRNAEIQPSVSDEAQKRVTGIKIPERVLFELLVIGLNYELLHKIFGSTLNLGFLGSFETLGVAFAIKNFDIGKQRVTLRFDFINQARDVKLLREKYYQCVSGGLFVYDLAQKASFARALQLLDEFNQVGQEPRYRVLIGYANESKSKWYPSPESIDQVAVKHRIAHYELDLRKEEETHQTLNDIYRQVAGELASKYLKTLKEKE